MITSWSTIFHINMRAWIFLICRPNFVHLSREKNQVSTVANVPLLIDWLYWFKIFFIRYRSIKDGMTKSGAGRSGWEMDQILHRDKATEPAATSSLSKKNLCYFDRVLLLQFICFINLTTKSTCSWKTNNVCWELLYLNTGFSIYMYLL